MFKGLGFRVWVVIGLVGKDFHMVLGFRDPVFVAKGLRVRA